MVSPRLLALVLSAHRIFAFIPPSRMLRQRRCTLNLKSPLSNGSVEDFLNEVTSPIQNVLDGASEGWALSYADLSPDTEQTIPGIAFLITNIAYAVAGTLLAFQGDVGFGLLVDVAAFVSFNYHCKQLEVEGSMGAPSVRLALLIDYLVAGTAILCGTFFMLTTPTFPLQGAIFAGVSLVFLGLCWIYEEGKPYMVLHGIWHLLSAYAAWLVGIAHVQGY